jgi:16S rRNA (cytosine1402-N4)-methyltransferase
VITGYVHTPVLLDEVLEWLNIHEGGVYIDCTFGRGGHDQAILQRLGPNGRLLAMDRDPAAVAAARSLEEEDRRFSIQQGSFTMIEQLANKEGVTGKVDGVLFDLGVSSPQLADPKRGFSFSHEGPLDMRMDIESGMSAAEWLGKAPHEAIADVLWRYGEERFSRRIARAIVEARGLAPIETTKALAEIISRAKPVWEKDIHPATRSFQAIRIFINRELEELAAALPQAVRVLALGGRLLVISFHSLEDRIVKRFMRTEARGEAYPRGVPAPLMEAHHRLKLVGRAIRPSEMEVSLNPRARSAVLRVAERVA